jgi:hypothetical protein
MHRHPIFGQHDDNACVRTRQQKNVYRSSLLKTITKFLVVLGFFVSVLQPHALLDGTTTRTASALNVYLIRIRIGRARQDASPALAEQSPPQAHSSNRSVRTI